MFINEYGDKRDPLVLLLVPMMVSGEELYQLMHPYFRHNYHYIAPDRGGHGKAGEARVFKEDRRWDCLKTM
jgi:hypothetical protein